MIPVPLMYFVRSETGQHMGYIFPVEVANLIAKNKPPPDERKCAEIRFSEVDNTNSLPMDSAS